MYPGNRQKGGGDDAANPKGPHDPAVDAQDVRQPGRPGVLRDEKQGSDHRRGPTTGSPTDDPDQPFTPEERSTIASVIVDLLTGPPPIVVTKTADDLPEPVCDFCSETPPTMTYRTAPVATLALDLKSGDYRVDEDADGLWAACDGCWPLINAGALNGLVDRCLDRVGGAHLPAPARRELRQAIFELHAAFLRGRRGPGWPGGPDDEPGSGVT